MKKSFLQGWRAACAAGAVAMLLAIAPPAFASGEGFAIYSAQIQATGNVVNSNGVLAAALTKLGNYRIQFRRPINGCSFIATLIGPAAGQVNVALKAGTNDTIAVHTFDGAGVLQSRNFYLVVTCGP